jgi:O-antigen/teichoic acid export membrane protein
MFTAVGSSGLGITAAKHVAEHRFADKRRVGEVVGVSLIISAGFGIACACIQALLAPVLAYHTLQAPALAIQLEVAALIVLFSSLNTAQIGVLQGFEAFREIVRLNSARAAVTLVLVAVGAFSKGLSGAVYGYAAASVIVAALQQRAIRRICRECQVTIRYSCPQAELISLLKFSLAVLVSATALVPASWWAMAQLATRTGYGQVGLFTAMYQWQSAITFVSSAIIASSLPVLTSVLADGKIGEYRSQIRRVFMLASVSAAMVALPVALMSGSIVRLYGKDFRGATFTLVIVCIFSFLNAAGAPIGTMLWSTGSTKAALVLALIGGVSLLLFAAMLTGRGATGLAFAYLGLSSVQVLTAWLWWTFFKSRHRLTPVSTSSLPEYQ